MSDFEGLRAIVTGGGVGHRAGDRRELSARGARVAVLDLEPRARRRRAASASRATSRTTPASTRRWRPRPSELGGIDIVVTNAGIGAQGTVADNDDDEWHRVLDVNVVGIVRTVPRRAARTCAGPRRRRSSTPRSIASWCGLPSRALYSASKGAVLRPDARHGRRPRARGDPRQRRQPRARRHAVGRTAARRRPRPRRRAGGARGTPADGPPRQRRRGRRRDLLPGRRRSRRRPPAPCSPSTAACTGCACVHRPDAAPGRRQRARRRSRAGAPRRSVPCRPAVRRRPRSTRRSVARPAHARRAPLASPRGARATCRSTHRRCGRRRRRRARRSGPSARACPSTRPRCPGTAGRRSSPSTTTG